MISNRGGKKLSETKTALLLIDVISDFEFEDGEKLFKPALTMARKIAEFKKHAKKKSVPVIYVNDNFGHWRDDFNKTIGHCSNENVRGSRITKILMPEADDYFVLKPKHSAFYSTALEPLLEQLNAKKLILTGISADICVLLTAADAYMRGFELFIPRDCIAAVETKDKTQTLKYVERVLKADTRPSAEIKFE